MKKMLLTAGLMISGLCGLSLNANAQECSECSDAVVVGHAHGGKVRALAGQAVRGAAGLALGANGIRNGEIVDADGRTQPQADFINPKATLVYGVRDHFSPAPIYAYSSEGLRAGHVHAWNQQQANIHSWHGGYNTWRWGQPTAMVVPPTASYMSSYNWGVAQTRSTPIHHQFGRGPGSYGGIAGGGMNTPYQPWSTDQFGYYPVRASW